MIKVKKNSNKIEKNNSFKKLNKKIESVENCTRKAFNEVKKEFEEHLESINEGTNEIQSNYESILRIETRLDKVEGMLTEINQFIKQFKTQNVYFLDDDSDNLFNIMPLTEDEKKIFKIIYELENEGIKTTYLKISDLSGISISLVREHVNSLIEKGIPIIKNYLHQQVHISLEPKFREIQIKQNIINI
jgi:HSP90 family molecular chaperone